MDCARPMCPHVGPCVVFAYANARASARDWGQCQPATGAMFTAGPAVRERQSVSPSACHQVQARKSDTQQLKQMTLSGAHFITITHKRGWRVGHLIQCRKTRSRV